MAGVPTLPLDPSINDVPERYRYKWLNQTDRYSLGRFLDGSEVELTGLDIKDVMAMMDDSSQYNELAEKNQLYVLEYHGVSSVVDKLVTHKTTASHADIKRYTPATWKIATKLGKLLR